MNRFRMIRCVLIAAAVLTVTVYRTVAVEAVSALAEGKKVLVVMSYHEGYGGEEEIKGAVLSLLGGAEVRFVHLDTKKNLAGGEERAREAFRLYREFQPDAVIAANDNAQSLFVVPFLKGKVETPVVFCGVNNDATKYGYPAVNVTGVLEKKHYRESISFSQVVKPAIRKIGIVYKDHPTNLTNLAQIEEEKASYAAEITTAVAVTTLAEAEAAVADLSPRVDAVLFLNLTGVLDSRGLPLEGKEALSSLAETTGLPTIGSDSWEVKAGVLCGVIQSDAEQGALAVEMLYEIWGGKAVVDIPVTENVNGLRYVNITTLKRLGLKLEPEVVIGTEMVVSGQP